MSEKRNVLRAAGIVGFFTLLSRFTGLARDAVTAAMFGGSRMADTFLTALELTNQVRRVLGEGALSAFIVPLMTERRARQGGAAGWLLYNRVFNLMFVLSLLISLLGIAFAPFIFGLFGGRALLVEGRVLDALRARGGAPVSVTELAAATGYSPAKLDVALDSLTRQRLVPGTAPEPPLARRLGDGRAQADPGARDSSRDPHFFFEQGAAMTRLLFPYVVGLTLAAVMMGACHTLRQFGVPSVGSIILNLPMIAAGLLAMAHHRPGEPYLDYASRSAWWLCQGVLLGAVLRVLWMVPTLMRHGWRWRPVLNLRDRDLRKLLGMMSLGMLDVSLSQINFAVSGYFAMFLAEGVKTYISYANRLIQFPMALTATALGTAMLPQLTQFLLEGRNADLRDMMAFVKRLEIIFIMPAVVGLMLLGEPILALIFQHGHFTAQDTRGTYLALICYAPALLPLGWTRMLQPLYFARKDMWTPLKASLASVTVNITLNWYFAYHTDFKQIGMGLANSLAAFTGYGMLMWFLRGELRARAGEHPRIAETFMKTLLAALLACAAGAALLWALRHGAPAHGLVQRGVILPVIGAVALLYFVFVRLLHVPDGARAIDRLLGRLKRSRRKTET